MYNQTIINQCYCERGLKSERIAGKGEPDFDKTKEESECGGQPHFIITSLPFRRPPTRIKTLSQSNIKQHIYPH